MFAVHFADRETIITKEICLRGPMTALPVGNHHFDFAIQVFLNCVCHPLFSCGRLIAVKISIILGTTLPGMVRFCVTRCALIFVNFEDVLSDDISQVCQIWGAASNFNFIKPSSKSAKSSGPLVKHNSVPCLGFYVIHF